MKKRDVALAAALLVMTASGLYLAATSLREPSEGLSASVRAASVFSLSNAERKAQGLAPLTQSALLTRAAQLKAEDMAREGYYAHISPDGETPMYWLDTVGYKYEYIAENLTANIREDERVVSAWMGSPSHRRSLLDAKFTEMGIGVAFGTYKGRDDALFVVQMLAKPRSVAPTPAKPKPVTVPKPSTTPLAAPAKPATPTVKENVVTNSVKDLTDPLIKPLTASTSALFTSTTTDSVPLVISTTSVPIELRAPEALEVIAPPEDPQSYRDMGKKTSVRWVEEVGSFFSEMAASVQSLLRF